VVALTSPNPINGCRLGSNGKIFPPGARPDDKKEPMRRPRAGGRQGVGSRTAWHRQAGEGLVTKASSRVCPKATTSPARLPNPARRRFLHANGQATSWVKNRKLGRICRRFDLVC
jgi:hypothetical protein